MFSFTMLICGERPCFAGNTEETGMLWLYHSVFVFFRGIEHCHVPSIGASTVHLGDIQLPVPTVQKHTRLNLRITHYVPYGKKTTHTREIVSSCPVMYCPELYSTVHVTSDNSLLHVTKMRNVLCWSPKGHIVFLKTEKEKRNVIVKSHNSNGTRQL